MAEGPSTNLTPYLSRLDARLHDAVAEFLGLAVDRVEVGLRTDRIEVGWQVDDDDAIQLVLRESADGAWSAGGWTVTCKRLPREMATRRSVRAGLATLASRFGGADQDPADLAAAAKAMTEAAAARWSFLNERDEAWRRVEQTTYGEAGMLRLGFVCNQNCGFCPQSRSWQDPPWDLVETWLEEFAAMGLQHLTITGGEPSAYRGLPDVVRRATGHGMKVLVQTNAIRFASDRYTASLVDAGLDSVFVSFHSHRPEISDGLTRARGTWERTVKGIETLLTHGVRVAMNCCVVEENVDTLPDHAQFIVDRLVRPFPQNPVFSVDYSQPGAYFDEAAFQGSVVSLDRVTQGVSRAARTLRDAGVRVNSAGTCGFPLCSFRDDPEVIAWHRVESLDANDLEARGYGAACERCAAKPWCPGVRLQVLEAFGEDALVPYTSIPETVG